MPKGEGNVVAQNKKARHDYSIVDTIEAGIVLTFGIKIQTVRENYCLRRSKSPNFKMTLREQV